MGDVVHWGGITTVDVPAAEALEKAKGWGMDRCVVIGTDADGELHMGGSTSDVAFMIFIMELAKKRLLDDR